MDPRSLREWQLPLILALILQMLSWHPDMSACQDANMTVVQSTKRDMSGRTEISAKFLQGLLRSRRRCGRRGVSVTRHLAYLGQFIPRPENLEHPLIGACSLNAWTSWNRRLFCNLSRRRLGRVGGIRIWGSFLGAPKAGFGGVKPGFGAPKKEVPQSRVVALFWVPSRRCPKAGFGRFRRW